MTLAETKVRGASGETLHVRTLGPDRTRAEGCVLFCHGLGEHSARHLHVAEACVSAGWRAVLFDLPGHGRSSGPRGPIPDFDDFTRDLERVRAATVGRDERLVLRGHSMGALVVMRSVLTGLRPPDGAILSAPWLDLRMKVAGWKLRLGRWAARHFPAFTLRTGVSGRLLAADPGFLSTLPDPHLVHRKISAALFFGATRMAARVSGSAHCWRTPLLMLLGEEDPVIDNAAAIRFFEKVPHPSKTLRLYPGMLHEPHNEPGRETVLREIAAWLGGRMEADALPPAHRAEG
jgi:alpha-beta hydrolase superfamily lysophospholipase